MEIENIKKEEFDKFRKEMIINNRIQTVALIMMFFLSITTLKDLLKFISGEKK